MAYNKFITKDGTVMLDLTNTTVSAETLVKNTTALDRSGNKITGTFNIDLQEKTATTNGVVVADAEYYGLKSVKVNTPVPQLIAPIITLEKNILTITNKNNIAGISLSGISYDLYIDDELVKNTNELSINIDQFNLGMGVYGLKVIAKCDKFIDSAASNTV